MGAVLALLSGCPGPGATSTETGLDVGTPTAVSSIQTPLGPVAADPDPQRGRAGWFWIPEDEHRFAAARLPDGRCVAMGDDERWLIDVAPAAAASDAQPCDGPAVALPPLPRAFFSIRPLGKGLLFAGSDDVWVAASPEATPTQLKLPFELHATSLATSGDAILAVNKGTLHRYDGTAWDVVRLDADVLWVRGSPSGLAYAVTKKNGIHRSHDAGKTWSAVKHAFTKIEGLSLDGAASKTKQPLIARGQGRRANGTTGELEVTLDPAFDVAAFERITVWRPLPEGVTDRDGVPLPKKRAVLRALREGRSCVAFDIRGDVAAGACHDDRASFLTYSDDAGKTVRVIHTDAQPRHVRAVELARREILTLQSCEYSGSEDECEKQVAMLYVPADDGAWSAHQLEIEAGDRIVSAHYDREGDGGFYLVGHTTPPGSPGQTVVYHTEGGKAVRHLIDGNAFPAGPTPFYAMSAHVAEDGVLRLLDLFAENDAVSRLGIVRVSRRFEVAGVDLVDRASLPSLMPGDHFAGAYGNRIAALIDNRLLFSEDAGKTVRGSKPQELSKRFYDRVVTCGSAGCDLGRSYKGTALGWRWGDKPMAETAEGKP